MLGGLGAVCCAARRGSQLEGSRPVENDEEPLLAGDEGVGLPAGQVDDTVARSDLVRLALLPREAGPAEDLGDLLLLTLAVHRRRALPRQDLDAVDADRHRAGGGAEIRPVA